MLDTHSPKSVGVWTHGDAPAASRAPSVSAKLLYLYSVSLHSLAIRAQNNGR